jgi:hypothetical protein
MNSASLCSLAGRNDNPIPTQFLVPIDCLKNPAPVLQQEAQTDKDKILTQIFYPLHTMRQKNFSDLAETFSNDLFSQTIEMFIHLF